MCSIQSKEIKINFNSIHLSQYSIQVLLKLLSPGNPVSWRCSYGLWDTEILGCWPHSVALNTQQWPQEDPCTLSEQMRVAQRLEPEEGGHSAKLNQFIDQERIFIPIWARLRLTGRCPTSDCWPERRTGDGTQLEKACSDLVVHAKLELYLWASTRHSAQSTGHNPRLEDRNKPAVYGRINEESHIPIWVPTEYHSQYAATPGTSVKMMHYRNWSTQLLLIYIFF